MNDDIVPATPPVVITGWVQFHINMTSLGNLAQYTWAYKSSSNIVSPTTLNGFCQDLWNLIVVPWKAIHPTTVTLDSITAETRYPAVPNYAGVYNAPAVTTGNDTNPVLPGSVALAFSKLSGVRGRKYNGRTYLGFLTENNVTGDTVGNTYMTSAALFMAQHLNSMSRDSVTLSPAIASRAGNVMTEINRIRGNSLVDSQRRRLTGRGA